MSKQFAPITVVRGKSFCPITQKTRKEKQMYQTKKNQLKTTMSKAQVEELQRWLKKNLELSETPCEECAIKVSWSDRPESFCCSSELLLEEWEDRHADCFEEQVLALSRALKYL